MTVQHGRLREKVETSVLVDSIGVVEGFDETGSKVQVSVEVKVNDKDKAKMIKLMCKPGDLDPQKDLVFGDSLTHERFRSRVSVTFNQVAASIAISPCECVMCIPNSTFNLQTY